MLSEEDNRIIIGALKNLYYEYGNRDALRLVGNFLQSEKDIAHSVRLIIENWAAQQGHNRCWYYPDVFKEIATLVGAKIDYPPGLPDREEFEEGCCKYQEEQYGPKTSVPAHKFSLSEWDWCSKCNLHREAHEEIRYCFLCGEDLKEEDSKEARQLNMPAHQICARQNATRWPGQTSRDAPHKYKAGKEFFYCVCGDSLDSHCPDGTHSPSECPGDHSK